MVKKVSIAGNGIVGLMIAYLTHLRAREKGEQVRITIRGTHPVNKTTAGYLFPSMTENEILSVVPPGKKLLQSLEKLFKDFNGGIRVDSPEGILASAEEFIHAVEAAGCDEEAHQYRTKLLTELSKYSISLWESIYQTADDKLKKILEESNYLPCRERDASSLKLRDGYRIDLYFDAPNLKNTVKNSIDEYTAAGYTNVKVLTPDELEVLDPTLKEFCNNYSLLKEEHGQIVRIWKEGVAPLLRPGGCINTAKFLPRFAAYLEEIMGTYVNAEGKTKNNFRMKLGTVTSLQYSETEDEVLGWSVDEKPKTPKRHYEAHDFVLCPGEAVGTLRKLGVIEPAHARFVGASIKLKLPVEMVRKAGLNSDYKMNMALRTGVVSSVSQAGIDDEDNFFIGVAGMKAFYGLVQPSKEHEYAIEANVYQLNMLNKVYPRFLSLCLDKDTHGKQLTKDDLAQLETRGQLDRGVGSRAVTFDGVPTVDNGHNTKGKVKNLFVDTHWSSGGVTNAPAAAMLFEEAWRRTAPRHTKNPSLFFNHKSLPSETTEAMLAMMQSTRP